MKRLPSRLQQKNSFGEHAESANPHGQKRDPEVVVVRSRILEAEDEEVARGQDHVHGQQEADRGRVSNETVKQTKRIAKRTEQRNRDVSLKYINIIQNKYSTKRGMDCLFHLITHDSIRKKLRTEK